MATKNKKKLISKQNEIIDLENIAFGDQETTRKPVLEKALGPCLLVMQISGLYGIDATKRGKFAYYLHCFYMVFITLLLLGDFVINIKRKSTCNFRTSLAIPSSLSVLKKQADNPSLA